MNAVVSEKVIKNKDQSSEIDTSPNTVDVDAIIQRARQYAEDEGLDFAGGLPPKEAWALVASDAAVLVDVRTNEERKFVGHVPVGEHVAWATGTSLTRNPRFVKEVDIKVKSNKEQVILLLCRSGKRSAAAAEALTKAGFTQVYNVLEGFEGELDENGQRGHTGGWRFDGLPWQQD